MRKQTTPKSLFFTTAKMIVVVLIGLIAQTFLLAQAPTAQVKAIDVKATYRLSNDYTGPNKFLTVSENGVDLDMVDATRSPKQLWKFMPAGDGKFRMITMFDDEKYLDVRKRDDVLVAVMTETGDFSDETWSFATEKDGTLRFVNTLAGKERSLDVHKDSDGYGYWVEVSPIGDYSGQGWRLTKVDQ